MPEPESMTFVIRAECACGAEVVDAYDDADPRVADAVQDALRKLINDHQIKCGQTVTWTVSSTWKE